MSYSIKKNIFAIVCAFLVFSSFTGCNHMSKIYLETSSPESMQMPTPEPSETSAATEILTEPITDEFIEPPAPTSPPTETTEPQTATEKPTEPPAPEPTTEAPTNPPEPAPTNPPAETITSMVYKTNVEHYNGQATDKIALDYYLLPSYWIQSDDTKIIDLAASITNGISSEYDKAKAIYTWVANNNWKDVGYANGNLETRTLRLQENTVDALNTLETKVGTCLHYTKLTVALSRAVGMPAKVMRLEDGHEFSEIYADGRWVIMDAYFDCNNKYENGTYGTATLCGSRFFDITVEDIWERRAYYFQEYLDFAYYVETNYFYGNTNIESVIIPDGFYSIGDVAFYGCTNLESVFMPESVSSIGNRAFEQCSENLVIYGKTGSYAEKYAEENNIKFEPETK